MKRIFHHPFFIRLFNWEYWNSTLVYLPLYPYWLLLSIRARSFFFLTAANPSIRNGGFIMESKNDVYKLLPQELYPATCYCHQGIELSDVLDWMNNKGITFPVIAKPDYGERGIGVKKINTVQDMETYASCIPVPFLVQEYVEWENEIGLFYCQMPDEESAFISGIVNKEPVAIIGDGIHSMAQLVKKNARYLLQWKQIYMQHSDRLHDIPVNGERIVLVPYGNHSRGSKFTDVSYKITDQLTTTIDNICRNIGGFYFGRLDIKFNSWEDLQAGKNFSIIELNGSGSEPTHIYDPAHSILFAWKEIVRHWNILFKICIANNKKGTNYLTLKQGRKEIAAFKEIETQLVSVNL
jgi:hypothetical protein